MNVRSRLSTYQGYLMAQAVPLLATVLEVLWAHACLRQLGLWRDLGWARTPMGLAAALGVALATQVLVRSVISRGWKQSWVIATVLGGSVLLLAALIRLDLGAGYGLFDPAWGRYAQGNLPIVITALLFGAYLIWRGTAVGRDQVEFEDIYRKFLFGLVVLVVLLVFWGIATRGQEMQSALSTLGLYVLAQFATGLLGIGLVHLQEVKEAIARNRLPGEAFGRRWNAMLLVVVLAIVLAGLGLASIFSFRLASTMLGYLSTFANWLLIAFLYVIGYPLGVLAAALVYVLRFFVNIFGKGERPEQTFSPPGLGDIGNVAEGGTVWVLSPTAVLAIKWAVAALLALGVLFLLALAIRRQWRGDRDEGIEEVSESLWTWEVFREDLLGLLRKLLDWFRRRRAVLSAPEPQPPIASLETDDLGRLLTVREMYQGLLWEGYALGVPRSDYETPYEYRVRLRAAHPALDADVTVLTHAYVRVRYGEQEPPATELTALNRLWRRLRASLRIHSVGRVS